MKKIHINLRLWSRRSGKRKKGATKTRPPRQRRSWKELLRLVRWRLVIPCAVLTLAAAICWGMFQQTGNQFQSIYAAENWRGESELRYIQVEAFLPADEGKTETEIFSFRETLDQKMVDNSLESEGEGSLYADAYSAFDQQTVSSSRTSAQLDVIGVGGEFFLFHPMELLSGSYFAEDDFMKDGIVLDETAAWKLFGGYELTGMTVTIGNQSYVIMGVVAREDDKFTQEFLEDNGTVFMPFSALQKHNESALITCYEVAMPNPVKGFAVNLLQENFISERGEALEITDRYSVERMFSIYRQFGQRSIQEVPLSYPYWENAQRMAEDHAALYLLMAILLILFPFGTTAFYGIRFLRRTVRTERAKLKKRIEDRIECRRETKLEAAMAARQKQKEGSDVHGDPESASCEQGVR